MAVALTAYLTNVTATTLATAKKLQATAPGAEGNPTTKVAKVTGWGEIYAFGTANNWAGAGSEPAASGNGFLLDDTSLVGQSILAGTWTPTLKLASSQAGITITVNVRAWKRTSGGVYTLIAKYSRAGWALTTTAVVNPINTVVQAGVLTPFATGDKLYIDIVANVTANTANSNTLTIVVYENGGANEAVVTPGYQLTTLTPATASLILTKGTPIVPLPIILTPAAAVLTVSPRPLDDPALQGVWFQEDFTNAATRLDSSDKGNTLTQVNLVGQTAESKQGRYSASFERGRVALLKRTDANLSANFPGKSTATTKDFTVGCWVLIDVLAADNMWAMNKGTDGAFALYYHSGLQRFFGEINDGGSYTGARSWQVTPSTLTWYHIVMRVKGNTNKELALFVNGVKQTPAEVAVNATLVTDAGDFAIGAFAGGNHYWDGLIDECFIYSRALPDEEIKAIYTRGLDGDPPVVNTGTVLKPATATMSLTTGTPVVTGGTTVVGYRYSHLLTVDHTKVGANLTDFAVPVTVTSSSLRSAANGGKILNTVTQSGGLGITIPADLVFASDAAGTTKYPWEIESWDAVNGVLAAWVKLPALSATVDAPFYMAFGNSAITTQQHTGNLSPANVWDTNYRAVYHLAGLNATLSPDSTSYANEANASTVGFGTGKLSGGMTLDGTQGAYIGSPGSMYLSNNPATLSIWAKTSASTSYPVISYDGGNNILAIVYNYPTALRYGFRDLSTGAGGNVGGTTDNDGNWHYIVGVRDTAAGMIRLYVDGVQQASASVSNANTTTTDWTIGKYTAGGGGGNFTGSVDELRFSIGIARSAAWILTEYNAQNAPGDIGTPGFIVYGAEVDAAPAGTNLSPASKALAITAATPTLKATARLQPALKALAIAPGTPTVFVSATSLLTPATKALTIAPATPVLKSTVRLAPATKALAITPVAPTLKSTTRLQPATKALAIAPATSTLKSTVRVSPAAAVLAIAPAIPTLKSTIRLQPVLKALAIAPATPTLKSTTALAPASRVLSFTGTVPSLRATIRPVVRAIPIAPGVPSVVVLSPTGLHPATKALFLTPATPTIRTITVLHPAAAALTLAPRTSTLRATIRPTSRALTFTAGTPTVFISSANVLHPASKSLALTAGTPVLRTITVLHPATGALTLTLQLPALRTTTRPGSAALNLTRYTPTIRIAAVGQRTQPMVTIA